MLRVLLFSLQISSLKILTIILSNLPLEVNVFSESAAFYHFKSKLLLCFAHK